MIFYFSGTGNSFYVAKRLSDKFNEEIINISECIQNEIYKFNVNKNEKIGFIFPVYYFGVPIIIRNFIKKLEVNRSNYVYVIFTCESDIGGADMQIKKILKKINLDVNYIYQLPMPNNCPIYYDLPDENYQYKKIENANMKITEIAENISNKVEGGYKSNIIVKLTTLVAYPIYYFGRNTKNFYADSKCISCGLCKKICPINAIEIKDGKPKWIKSKCVYCLACYNRCPKQSIQIGKKTKNRKRFVNPILK